MDFHCHGLAAARRAVMVCALRFNQKQLNISLIYPPATSWGAPQ